jgi:hypothetical protein
MVPPASGGFDHGFDPARNDVKVFAFLCRCIESVFRNFDSSPSIRLPVRVGREGSQPQFLKPVVHFLEMEIE